ncbi:hypothetical protein [Niastella sp. OAS944]|uniref:hypothetical protein n=1 Tax=Niastella sp. OAS944 TaxID=2664089 RepID=UPI003493FBEF|nr:heme/copper-type cytochrome/quinol oxidase subunit 2 [Chitinophagaceae bacterium OAS944]
MGALVGFYLRVLFTLIMLAIFGFMVMYFVTSLKLVRLANKEENINKKRSGQKSLLWSLSGMTLVFFIWLIIVAKL